MKRVLFVIAAILVALWLLSRAAEPAQTNVTRFAGTVITTDSLNTVGYSDTLSIVGFYQTGTVNNIKSLTVVYTVVGYDSTMSVAIEGSLDKANWVNLNTSGNTTISANGTYFFQYNNISSWASFRFAVAAIGKNKGSIYPKWLFGE